MTMMISGRKSLISWTWRGRHPAGDRDGRGAEPLDAVVRAQPAGEQAVAVGVVHLVARPGPRRAQRAGHQAGPVVDVAGGVADDRGLARRARRRVDAPHLLLRHREHAERVVLPQVGLRRGGELGQVREVAAVVGVHARRVERPAVVRHVRVGPVQRLPQPRELQRAQLVDRHPLLGVERLGRRGLAEAGAHRAPRCRSLGASRGRCVDDSLASSLTAPPPSGPRG